MNELAASLRRLPADTLRALAFFTRLPVPSPAGPFELSRAAGAWPLAGLIVALPAAGLFLVARAIHCPPLTAALVALAALTLLGGGLHEDALADCADGLGGGRTSEQKLDIMRDSRIGNYGALALIFSVLIRATALAALAERPLPAAATLLGVAVLSRAVALSHWATTDPARPDGLAFAAGRPSEAALSIGVAQGMLAAFAMFAIFQPAALLGLTLAAAGVAFFTEHCRRAIGGHTGDTIGAAQQIAETLLLLGLSAGAASI
jgi:adenosylcobinamide-GDP ribazoletransferase